MAFLLLPVFLATIFYVAVLVRTIWRRRWRTLTILVSVPAAAIALLIVAVSLWASGAKARELNAIYDTPVSLPAPVFSYDSERAFNGDGYSISTYDLPESIRHRFQKPDQRLLGEFPARPSYRSHWKTVNWKPGPLPPSLEQYVEFALGEYSRDKKGLSEQFSAIRKALEKPTTFYSFFYNDPGKYVGDIDFFVIDLEDGKLYIINNNT